MAGYNLGVSSSCFVVVAVVCLFVCLSASCCLIRVETAFEKDTAKQGKSFTCNYFACCLFP